MVPFDVNSLTSPQTLRLRFPPLSYILIATNACIIVIIIYSTDRARRVRHARILSAVEGEVAAAEVEDKAKYEAAWAKYVIDAPEGTAEVLLAKLAALVKKAGGGGVPHHPSELNTTEALMAASIEHNDHVHGVLRAITERCGGDYHAGPVKLANRVQAKADSDYGGDVTKVVDTIRGSSILKDLEGFVNAVSELLGEGGGAGAAEEAEAPLMIRVKDRVTNPLDTGYMDVLINLIVPGCPVVCELQLHLEAIHDLKPMGHRVYKIKRAAGFDANAPVAAKKTNSGSATKVVPLPANATGEGRLK